MGVKIHDFVDETVEAVDAIGLRPDQLTEVGGGGLRSGGEQACRRLQYRIVECRHDKRGNKKTGETREFGVGHHGS